MRKIMSTKLSKQINDMEVKSHKEWEIVVQSNENEETFREVKEQF